jgi:hypothetical protein
VNVALTPCAALIVTTQVPVPEHPAPLHPPKAEPAPGVAVNITTVSMVYDAEQVAPQLIPAGLDVTVPVPVPVLLTVNAKVCKGNVAVTFCTALMVTTQVPVPEHPPPLQPWNVEPAAGVAVRVTTVELANDATQVVPQSITAGLAVTVPVPLPLLLTVRVLTAPLAVSSVIFTTNASLGPP